MSPEIEEEHMEEFTRAWNEAWNSINSTPRNFAGEVMAMITAPMIIREVAHMVCMLLDGKLDPKYGN